LEKLTILKVSEDSALDYVQTIIGAMEVICGMVIGLPAFTTTFCILELYHLLVSCLFGNEKLSKTKLAKCRGFGLNEEFFTHELKLSALGLKLAFPFFQQFCAYFSGERRRQSLGLIFSCLYYTELQSLGNEAASTELLTKVSNLLHSNLMALSDERSTEMEYLAVSLKQFADMYCRKFRRNLLKCNAARIFLEAYTNSQQLQETLCEKNISLFIAHSAQFCTFGTRNMNSAITSLKLWLKTIHFEELAAMWHQYAVKKATLSERDTVGISTIDSLLTLGSRDTLSRYGIDIYEAFLEPDTVARYAYLI
jgi:hypothetical protein